jgi:hypothetical protein
MSGKSRCAPGDEALNLRHNGRMKPEIAFIGLGVMGSSVVHVSDVSGAGYTPQPAPSQPADSQPTGSAGEGCTEGPA